MTYFFITLILVFIGINLTHSYLERRHLILAMESSLQRATQQIDRWRYYTGNVEENTFRFRSRGITTFIPIDCDSAKAIFDEEFSIQWALTQAFNRPDVDLKGQRLLGAQATGTPSSSSPASNRTSRSVSIPKITAFRCDGETIKAEAEMMIELPFSLSFSGVDLLRHSRQRASVEVGLVFGG